MNPVDAYAHEVVAGRVPAGKYHRLACSRHLKDRAREGTPEFPYRFVWEAYDSARKLKPCALRFLKFARQMKHYKGRQFVGKPFEPTPCQVFRLGSIFGWRTLDGQLRRFTTAYNEVPRKQGKSFEEAVVSIYCTFYEGEAGAEGYCLATKEKQAKIAFNAARKLVKSSGLSDRIKVNAANLSREATESKLEALGSDSDTTDGLNPHFVGVDELHAFKTRGLLDVVESATGSRLNPLIFQITTAGNTSVSVCGDQHDYACRILEGVLADDASTLAFFAFIAHADPEDDPWSEATWQKANPHWGISVEPDDMRKLAAKAKQIPSAAAEFKQKRLNLWVNASNPCLSVEGWRKGQTDWTPEDMTHEPCFVGVDLASKIDLCALSFVFPPTVGRPSWRIFQQLWTPRDTVAERAHRDKAPYPVWMEQGWLLPASGSSIDHDLVRQAILRWRDTFDIQQIGFDPWHADAPIQNLLNLDGFTPTQVIAVPQTYAAMSGACLRVQADILSGAIDARRCPVTAWAVSNTVDQRDGKDNLMFVKKKSRGRIDPVIALTIAVSLAIRHTPASDSVYEHRGAIIV